MTDTPSPPESRERRRRLADIFGDVLPETTADERVDERRGTDEAELWYQENRPPHHEDR